MCRICLNCNKELVTRTQKKFCSQSCAATYNNRGVRRHGVDYPLCAVCGKRTKRATAVYCSTECSSQNRLKKDKCVAKISKVIKSRHENIKSSRAVEDPSGIKFIHGPYTRKDGRKHSIITYNDNSKRTVSYPRLIMEEHLGRPLLPEETVDHINEDFTDDRIENLRLLSFSENTSRSRLRVISSDAVCVWCKKPFQMTRNQYNTRASNRSGPFCSKVCSGKYGSLKRSSPQEVMEGERNVKKQKIDI